jgi:branched-chain amino acid transport system substrate-binding protein
MISLRNRAQKIARNRAQKSARRGLVSASVISIAALALALSGCGSSGSSGGGNKTSASPITLGVVTILTGDASAIGLQSVAGIKQAVAEINKSGGVNGHMIDLNIADTNFQIPQAVELVRKMAENPNVLGIIGPLSTPELLAAAPVCGDVKIVCLSPGSTSKWPTPFNPWTFRNNLITYSVLPAIFSRVQKQGDYKSIAVVYDSTNECSVDEAALVKNTIAPNLGMKFTGEESYDGASATDYSSQLTKLLPTNPGILYVTGTADQVAVVIRQARQAGYKGLVMGGCASLNDSAVMGLSGGAVVNALTILPFNPGSTNSTVSKFVSTYEAANKGAVPSSFVASGYDAVLIMAAAAKAADTTTNRDKFRSALSSLKGVQGAAGIYTYNGSGDNTTQTYYLATIQSNGSYKIEP